MKWNSEIFNGSFSAVWTATIARVGAFFSISRDLQDLHTFAPRRSQNFNKKSSEILARMNLSSFHSSRKSMNFVIFLLNFDEILSEFSDEFQKIAKNLHFFIKFRSNFYAFFDASFWDSFFEFLVRLGAKKVDFGSPLAPSWAPNGAQNRPKGAQNRPSGTKMRPFSQLCGALSPTYFHNYFSERSWATFWSILGAIWGPAGRQGAPKINLFGTKSHHNLKK